ncbi:MAG: enoyl-CoA hydratase/isomerase family protein, partial [Deltaproteobacteria bacterium]|nr:enoyl-CoA hydratase/isomerase family protein [Candidatus Tharpella sp.]
MSYENVMVEIVAENVGEITLNRPKSLNTFSLPLALELNQALLELDGRDDVRVVILKGSG